VPVVVVVVNLQTSQLTFVLVAPDTVAVSVVDWPRMRIEPTDEETETVMTLAGVLLLQPFDKTRQTAANPMPRKLVILRNLIPTISPTQLRSAEFPLAFELFRLLKKSSVSIDPGPTVPRHDQNVRLTVKRNVVFGSK
jgi:hypothetical protein